MNKVVVVTLVLVSSIQPATTAWARLIGLQIQSRYDFSQVKQRGLRVLSDGHLSTNYNIVLRRPFLPASTLMSDFSINTNSAGDGSTNQNTRNIMLNVYSSQPGYQLFGRLNRSDSGTSSRMHSSTGYSTDYNAGLFLVEPAYPALNIQLMHTVSGTKSAGSSGVYETTRWLMSSYYDMAPFHFSFDRTQQVFGYSGSPGIQMNNQTSSVTLNQDLLSGLTMSAEMSKSSSGNTYANGNSSMRTGRRSIRLTATPTRSIVGNVDLSSQTNDQEVGAIINSNNNKSLSWSVRSGILPGVSMDYSEMKQQQAGNAIFGISNSESGSSNLSLAARLSNTTSFNISKMHSDFSNTLIASGNSQDSIQSALQTSLTPTTDFSLNFGRNKSLVFGGDDYDSSFCGASIRDRTSDTLSIGATYRYNKVRSLITNGSLLQYNNNVVDIDMLWQPTHDVGLNFRMSYQRNKGSIASQVIAPSGNIRWQIDPSTSLNANYSLQSLQQSGSILLPMFGQDTNSLTARLMHSFANGSYMDMSYDFQGSSVGDMQWRRQLRMGFTMTL